jgi:hypothetical protein
MIVTNNATVNLLEHAFFFAVLVFELRASCLLGRHCTA